MTNKSKRKNLKILLVSTPFLFNLHPPAGVSILKSYLSQEGYSVDVEHLSLQLYGHIDPSLFCMLSDSELHNEAIYSLFLFPSKSRMRKIRKVFYDRVKYSGLSPQLHNFEALLNIIEQFNKHVESTLFKKKYNIVGFSTVANQLLSSLYFSKKYKDAHPKAIIVFGGAQSQGRLGVSYLKAFPWLDYVVDGEGEETFLQLLQSIEGMGTNSIPGCSGRINGKLFLGPSRPLIANLDSLPVPDYDDYFDQINRYNIPISVLGLPLESSRGCWWSKCIYCNYCKFDSSYRRFSPKRIRQTMESLASRHHILYFRSVDIMHYHPPNDLCKELMKSHKKIRFYQEMRATITPDQIRLLKKAGLVDVQVGVESFSTPLLSKMNKGTTAIQNIQILKHLKQFGIGVFFNLITGFPGETKNEFRQTLAVIKICWHLVHNFEEASFTLENPSEMVIYPKMYGLKNLRPQDFYQYLFPVKYYEKLEFHRLDFDTARPIQGSYREALFNERWRGNANPSLTYEDGSDFIVINDHRRSDQSQRMWFGETVRDIYMYCDQIRSINNIKKHFASLGSSKIVQILNELCREKIMLREKDRFISLAIPHRINLKN